jgi:NAD(P)-dependent dehydrogenase (short-subunit alcohol dehydrogenase family)
MKPAIVITGASTGIGLETARLLVESGYRVFGTVRGPEDAARLVSLGADPLIVDVTNADTIESAARRVAKILQDLPLIALVNNAGVPAAGPVELADLREMRAAFEVNVFGTIAVTQSFLPLLRRSRGRILNVSSIAGRFVCPMLGPYAASKHALEALSDALRRELRPAGVDVVVIEPGPVRTPIWDKVAAIDSTRFSGTPYEHSVRNVQRAAVRSGRTGLPAERVAEAILHAITMRRPPARIPVVRSRLAFFMLRHLPVRWADRKAGLGSERRPTLQPADRPGRITPGLTARLTSGW